MNIDLVNYTLSEFYVTEAHDRQGVSLAYRQINSHTGTFRTRRNSHIFGTIQLLSNYNCLMVHYNQYQVLETSKKVNFSQKLIVVRIAAFVCDV